MITDSMLRFFLISLILVVANSATAQKKSNQTDSLGLALIQASKLGDYEKIVTLLNRGANINYTDKKGNTPLTTAAEYGNFIAVKTLLINGADVNKRTGFSAVDQAVEYNYPDIAELLITYGADLNTVSNYYLLSPLQSAVSAGNIFMVELLLKYKPDLETKDYSGLTALHLAVTANNDTMVYLLLDAGAKINATDNKGFTPLMFAVQYGYADLTRLLLENGADPNILTPDNISAMLLAVNNYQYETAKILLQFGANPNPPPYHNFDPLSLAKTYRQKDFIDLLQHYKAFANPKPSFMGWTMGLNYMANGQHGIADFYTGIYDLKYLISIHTGFGFSGESKIREKISDHLFYQYIEKRKIFYITALKYFNLINNPVYLAGIYTSISPVYTFAKYEGINKKPDSYFTWMASTGLWFGMNFVKIYTGYKYMPFKNYDLHPHWFNIGMEINLNLLRINNQKPESYINLTNFDYYD